ncbi:MAG: IPT/TIG domain-containing protein [Planctomycetes bacterium]|nr:IPT/TIG domain-containing protein [Planctomycetota bacterium]
MFDRSGASRWARLSAIGGATILAITSFAAGQTTTRISLDSTGHEIPGDCFGVISANGRFVAFRAEAAGVTPDDTDRAPDIFVRDLLTGALSRVSVWTDGSDTYGYNYFESISGDGRFVSFTSQVSNSVFGILIHDRDPDHDGVFDEEHGETTMESVNDDGDQANGSCRGSSISDDGRFVAFESVATNLVTNDSNLTDDVFVRDRYAGGTVCASVNPSGRPGNGSSGALNTFAISANGRYVVFRSEASDLVDGDTNVLADVFVRDIQTRTTTRVTLDSSGEQVNGSAGWAVAISADGRWIVFSDTASNMVAADTNGREDVFVRDMLTGTNSRVSVNSAGDEADDYSYVSSISPDGRFVAFTSRARNLVSSATAPWLEVYLHDRWNGETELVSQATAGVPAVTYSDGGSVSANGRYVVFYSNDSNLVPHDTVGYYDVFLRSRWSVRVASVMPASGSESGGDFVHIRGEGLTSSAATSVTIGGATATIVSAAYDEVTAWTPPGRGVADVIVTSGNDSSTLPAAFTYVDSPIAARWGDVGQGQGTRESVLLLNATSGDSLSREVRVPRNQPILLVMLPPSTRATARFVLYVWDHHPTATTLTTLPAHLGRSVFPLPFRSGTPQPRVIWNNVGYRQTLGAPTFASQPAPFVVANRASGIAGAVRLTFQGLIEDPASQSPTGFSVTNAILLRVE